MSFNPGSALLTDLYQLTMLHGYVREGMTEKAVFELFLHDSPDNRNFLVAAGLEQALQYLESFHFTDDECRWLSDTGRFDRTFIDYLGSMRFTGDAYAMPEGTIFFGKEPLLQIIAPLPEAQVIETRLINLINFQSMIASKAVRSVITAPNKLLVDFGLRRAHGEEAGVMAARASYLAGFSGTSNVLAAKEFDIPMYGTMAHSYIMAHDDEAEAFLNYVNAQPDNIVFLIDTYDIEEGARKVVQISEKIQMQGHTIKAVRIDSGNMLQHSYKVRRILDESGLENVNIFASGDLDEYSLKTIIGQNAPIDGFGIGTRMVASEDKPYLNCVYKLQEYAGIARLKKSEGKQTLPGQKQVYRHYDKNGLLENDIITVIEDQQDGKPLLYKAMENGKRLHSVHSLEEIRKQVKSQVEQLPSELLGLEKANIYPVLVSDKMKSLMEDINIRLRE